MKKSIGVFLCAPLLAFTGSLLAPMSARPEAALARAASVPGRQPVLMISIDGLMPEAVLNADAHGLKIPNLRRLLSEGSYAREVVNVNPTVTNPNHASLVTGALPSEHGIYNNRPFAPLERAPKMYGLYSDIKAPTLWHAAKSAGLTTGSIFWPVTRKAGDIDFNITDGDDEDEAGIAKTAGGLIARHRPQLLTVHFVSLDHRAHETGPFSPPADAALERIDLAIGQIIADERKTYPDAVVVIVSDHGFARVSEVINLNVALAEAGFITVAEEPKPSIVAWKASAWYVGASAMIVLRDRRDRETGRRVMEYLQQLANDPANGIEHIYARDEIAALGFAPNVDFVVAFRNGYRMGTALTGPVRTPSKGGAHGAFATRTIRRDMHSAFLITGPGIAAARDLGTIDIRQIAPTVAGKLKIALPSATMTALSLVD